MKKRDKIVTSVILLVAVVFFVYRYITMDKPVVEETQQTDDAMALRKLSAENYYDVPGKIRQVRYNIFIDAEGVIQEVSADDLNDPTHQGKMDEFAAELLPMVKGQKLSDIQSLDMVGTSSLTTKSFNAILPELRASI